MGQSTDTPSPSSSPSAPPAEVSNCVALREEVAQAWRKRGSLSDELALNQRLLSFAQNSTIPEYSSQFIGKLEHAIHIDDQYTVNLFIEDLVQKISGCSTDPRPSRPQCQVICLSLLKSLWGCLVSANTEQFELIKKFFENARLSALFNLLEEHAQELQQYLNIIASLQETSVNKTKAILAYANAYQKEKNIPTPCNHLTLRLLFQHATPSRWIFSDPIKNKIQPIDILFLAKEALNNELIADLFRRHRYLRQNLPKEIRTEFIKALTHSDRKSQPKFPHITVTSIEEGAALYQGRKYDSNRSLDLQNNLDYIMARLASTKPKPRLSTLALLELIQADSKHPRYLPRLFKVYDFKKIFREELKTSTDLYQHFPAILEALVTHGTNTAQKMLSTLTEWKWFSKNDLCYQYVLQFGALPHNSIQRNIHTGRLKKAIDHFRASSKINSQPNEPSPLVIAPPTIAIPPPPSTHSASKPKDPIVNTAVNHLQTLCAICEFFQLKNSLFQHIKDALEIYNNRNQGNGCTNEINEAREKLLEFYCQPQLPLQPLLTENLANLMHAYQSIPHKFPTPAAWSSFLTETDKLIKYSTSGEDENAKKTFLSILDITQLVSMITNIQNCTARAIARPSASVNGTTTVSSSFAAARTLPHALLSGPPAALPLSPVETTPQAAPISALLPANTPT